MTSPFVKRYLIALDQHKLIGLTSFAAVVGVSSIVALQSPPPTVYNALGVLAYNSPPTALSTFGTQIQQEGRQLSEDILLSDNVINAATERVKVNPKQIRKNVKFIVPGKDSKGGKDAAPQSQVIQVKYTDDDPKRAGATLAALMQAMVEQSRTMNTARLKAIIQSLNQRLPPVKQDLEAAQQKLERYIRAEGPAILAAEDGTLLGAINGSMAQQRQIQLQMETVTAQMRSLQSKLGLNPDQAYTSSALSADPILASLRAQILQNETQLEIYGKDLRPEHPTMVALRKQQQAYEKLLQQRATEVLGGNGMAAPLPSQIRQDSNLDPARQQQANMLVNLQTALQTLQQQLFSTAKSEQELRRQYALLPNKQLEQARIQQQVQIKQAYHDKIQAALADAQAAEAETVSSLSIARQPEIAADVNEAPNVPITLGAGALIGLIVAGGLIFLLSSLDGKFYTVEDVRTAVSQREVLLLGELPYVYVWEPNRGETPVLVHPESPYLEFYERFRTNLRLGSDQPLKVVMLTSTEAGEGKTISAYNLAIASARAGKRTLLIEADLRSPSFAKSLRLAPDPDASIDPLRYYGAKNECIRLVPDIENLYIVPSAGPQRQAASIIESSELRRLLDDVRGRFDLVVLDTPALSLCNDALLLEPYTDGIVLVTRPGYTQENMMAEAIDQFIEAEMPLLGVVINGVDKPIAFPPNSHENFHTQVEQEAQTVVT
jgi:capsular exopolysaccharide synthesis family protein